MAQPPRHVHHAAVDHVFLALNVLFLVGIAFVPFTSALLAEYMGSSEDLRTVAVLVFAGVQLVIALIYNVKWIYAARQHRLMHDHLDRNAERKTVRTFRFGPLGWVVTLLVAFVSSVAAIVIIFASVVLWLTWTGFPPALATKTADVDS